MKQNVKIGRRSLMLITLAAGGLWPAGRSANGALSYWDTNGATAGAGANAGTWGTSNFWSTSSGGTAATTAWASGNTAVFSAGTDATGVFTVSPSGTQTVGGMNFEEGTVTIASGGTLTLNGAGGPIDVASGVATIDSVIGGAVGLTKTGAGTLVLGGANTYTGGTTISAGTLQVGNGAPSGSIAGSITNNAALVFKRSNSFTYSSNISGSGSVTQAGTSTSTLTLSGANSYSGGTTVDSGTLTASGASGLGATTGTLAVNNPNTGGGSQVTLNLSTTAATTVGSLSGTITPPSSGTNRATINNGGQLFTVNQTTPGTYAGAIAGTGGFVLGGLSTSTLTLSGVNTYTGGTTINGGTLQVAADNNLGGAGTLTFDGGTLANTLSFSTSRAVTLNSGGGNFDGTLTLTLTGVISGTGTLNKNNTGTLVLTGANTYSGGTTLNAGTLTASGASGLGATTGTLAVNNPNSGAGSAVVLNLSTTAATTVGSLSGTIATPSSGTNTATINSGGQLFTVNQITPGTYAGVIAGTGGFVLGGLSTSTLTLSGTNTYTGGTTINAGTVRVAADSNLGGAGSLTFGGGTLANITNSFSISRAVTLNSGGGTINVGPTLTFTGVISGMGVLTKTGTGVLVLTGSNTYTGGTVVNAGTLRVAADNNLGGGGSLTFDAGTTLYTTGTFSTSKAMILNGAVTCKIDPFWTLTASGVISGAGSLTITNGGAGLNSLILTNANTYTGGTTLNDGTLSVSADNNLGNANGPLTLSGATLRFGAAFDLSASRAMNITGGATIDTNGFDSTISQVITGSGSLTKVGAGTLALSGLNLYSGVTTINGGALSVAANTLGPGSLTVGGGGTLRYAASFLSNKSIAISSGGTLDTNSFNPTIGGTISGGALTKTGTGILTLTSASNTYLGTNCNGGELAVSSDDRLGDSVGALNFNGGGLRFNAAFSLATSRAITLAAGGGTINTNGFDISVYQAITGAGGLTKTGAGNLSLLGANSYSGPTTINAGGKLSVNGTLSSGSLANSGQLASTGTTLTFSAASTNASGAKINLIDSTLNLGSGANKLTNSGRINLIDCTVNGDIASLSGGVVNTAGDVTFNGSITGGASLLEVGSGVTKMAAVADPTNSASVTPGVSNVNSLTVAGKLNLTNNRIITNDAQGTESGLIYTGVQGLVQSLKISTDQPLAAANQTAIGVATAAESKGLSGAATTLWSGQTVDSNDTLVMYTWAGDANLDGKVNADDYASIDLYSTIAGADSWNHGDFNYNGVINADDYALIDNNVQNVNYVPYWTTNALRGLQSGGSATAGLTAVPEPASVGLLMVSAAGLLGRRRRAK
jgi:fibronectin-binding autotransporter adhesin